MSNKKYRIHKIKIGPNIISWYEWGERDDNFPSIFLVHATGFHGRCWEQVVQLLPDRHIVAIDMRGHGQSENYGPFTWNVFGDDIIEFLTRLDMQNLLGVGHSLGGYALTHALSEAQSRFVRALLIDPVIMDPRIYFQGVAKHDKFLNKDGQHPVERRRNEFADKEDMFNSLVGKGGFAQWTDASLRDYCRYGLVKASDGYELACSPKIEAAIYMGSTTMNIIDMIGKIDLPVTVLRAEERVGKLDKIDFSKSPTWPEIAQHFPQGKDVYLPEKSHMMPMQDPVLIAEYILS
ncbi:MAG: alpha/beta hydrolase [Pseudomonadales bacterium]|nr:alpha/beta hydrolase [Pseudomonadales bacterium]